MIKSRFIPYLVSVLLLFSLISGVILNQTSIRAADEPTPTPTPAPAPTPPPPSLDLNCKYPVVSTDAGQIFVFDLDVNYQGPDQKRVDLVVSAPQNWSAYTTASYPEDKQINAIDMAAATFSSDTLSYTPTTESIKVNVYPQYGLTVEPGSYTVTLTVSSGNLKKSLDLTAQVTPKYAFYVTTDSGNLTAKAVAGEDNHVAIQLTNTGTVSVDNIALSATVPEGWTIRFNPNQVDSLSPGLTKDIDAIVKPAPGKTGSGDYIINIKAENQSVSANADFRITVTSPSMWGWVSLGIVLAVIAGAIAGFVQLSRR